MADEKHCKQSAYVWYVSKTCTYIQNPAGLPRVNAPAGKSWNAVGLPKPFNCLKKTPVCYHNHHRHHRQHLFGKPVRPFPNNSSGSSSSNTTGGSSGSNMAHSPRKWHHPSPLSHTLDTSWTSTIQLSSLQNWSATFCRKPKETTRHTGPPTSITSA